MYPNNIKHVHTYILWKRLDRKIEMRDGEPMYKCNNPTCTHVAPYSMVVDKEAYCGKCGKVKIILTKENLRPRNNKGKFKLIPTCLNCGNSKEAREYQATKKIADTVLGTVSFEVD